MTIRDVRTQRNKVPGQRDQGTMGRQQAPHFVGRGYVPFYYVAFLEGSGSTLPFLRRRRRGLARTNTATIAHILESPHSDAELVDGITVLCIKST